MDCEVEKRELVRISNSVDLYQESLTDIIILFALVVIPHGDGQTLLGQVDNIGHEHKLSVKMMVGNQNSRNILILTCSLNSGSTEAHFTVVFFRLSAPFSGLITLLANILKL